MSVSSSFSVGHAAGAAPRVSDWLETWCHLIPAAGTVLDLACGRGRHAVWLAQRGYQVLGVDRDATALAELSAVPGVQTRCADLEAGTWPLAGMQFDAVLVTNYLHRPLWPHLLDALAPGGVLIYETFAAGNAEVGRPANPEFLLQAGELLDVARGRLRVIAFQDVFRESPVPAFIQRICAVREPFQAVPEAAKRYALLQL
jgi:SAM-dependent methyltransferase